METAIDKLKEITDLTNRYGQPEMIDVALHVANAGRNSEVVIAIMRPNGKLISITKPFYPKGTYRLPSGGIEEGESIESALYREVHEETGLRVEIVNFVAIIRYWMDVNTHNFTSYVFLVNEIEGKLACNDVNEQISGFKEITSEELRDIIAHLQSIKGEFEEWAQFRAVAHKAVLKAAQ